MPKCVCDAALAELNDSCIGRTTFNTDHTSCRVAQVQVESLVLWREGYKLGSVRVLLGSIVLGVVACSADQPQWSNLKEQMIGRSYQDIVACAGIPDTQATIGENTGAVLYRDTVYGGFSCDATLIIKQSRVASVTQREIPSTDGVIHIPPDRVMWPDYKLCSRRFASCHWSQ